MLTRDSSYFRDKFGSQPNGVIPDEQFSLTTATEGTGINPPELYRDIQHMHTGRYWLALPLNFLLSELADWRCTFHRDLPALDLTSDQVEFLPSKTIKMFPELQRQQTFGLRATHCNLRSQYTVENLPHPAPYVFNELLKFAAIGPRRYGSKPARPNLRCCATLPSSLCFV